MYFPFYPKLNSFRGFIWFTRSSISTRSNRYSVSCKNEVKYTHSTNRFNSVNSTESSEQWNNVIIRPLHWVLLWWEEERMYIRWGWVYATRENENGLAHQKHQFPLRKFAGSKWSFVNLYCFVLFNVRVKANKDQHTHTIFFLSFYRNLMIFNVFILIRFTVW